MAAEERTEDDEEDWQVLQHPASTNEREVGYFRRLSYAGSSGLRCLAVIALSSGNMSWQSCTTKVNARGVGGGLGGAG